MKTFFTTLSLLFLIASTASGQILKVGLRGGMNINSYSFETVNVGTTSVSSIRGSNDPGFQFGAVMRLSIPKFIHIQPEFNLVSRNYNLAMTTEGGAYSRAKINVKSVEVPLTFGFNIGAIRLFGGPVFILSTNQSVSPKEKNLKMHIDENDIAMLLGIGIDAGNFFLDARYSTFNKTTKTEFAIGDSAESVKVKNDEMWQFSLGFFF